MFSRYKLVLLVLLIAVGLAAGPASLMAANEPAPPKQTVPTRTPTPGPSPTGGPPAATATPGSQPPAPPPATQPPTGGPAPTDAAATVAPSPTQPLEPIPTSETCAQTPLAQAQDTVNVRSGPEPEAEAIGELLFGETRPVVGQSDSFEWWLVQFGPDQIGWVPARLVTVSGCLDQVPIVAPLSEEASRPTGETEPQASTGEPAQESTPASLPAASVPEGGSGTVEGDETSGPTSADAAAEEAADAAEGSLQSESAGGGNPFTLLLVVGILFIIVGLGLTFFSRR